MHPTALSERAVIDVWEDGLGASSPRRALLLLGAALAGAAGPDSAVSDVGDAGVAVSDPPDPGRLPVGSRNLLLLDARAATFGDHLACVAECEHCDARLELRFSVNDIRTDPPSESEVVVRWREGRITCVLPTAADLVRAHGAPDPRAALLRACAGADLPPEAAEAVGEALAKADPGAQTQLRAQCPECGESNVLEFDIAEHFWAEVDSYARRLLFDVHALAMTYGWTEADVLAVSPARRRFYLEAVAR